MGTSHPLSPTAVDEHHHIKTVDHLNPQSQPLDSPSKPQINGPKLLTHKLQKNKIIPDELSFVSSSSTTIIKRGIRINKNKRKNIKFKSCSDVEAIAFPLGMSIAAVLAQVLEKDLASENVAIDHLAMICTSAVRESLTNVFGNKFDAFARNFEKSFASTLSTLSLINNSSIESNEVQVRHKNVGHCYDNATQAISPNRGDSTSSCDITNTCTESVNLTSSTQQLLRRVEEVEDIDSAESMNLELQGHVSSQIVVPNMTNYLSSHSVLHTFEKSVVEQTRANDLKSVEIGLTMKKLQLKEAQLALNSDLNILERCKLSLGIATTSFKAERFKSQLEETRHGELLKICMDFLFADLLIMSACLFYGVYAFSYDNLRQLTRSCSASEVSKSWWIPKSMTSVNSVLQTLNCQFQVWSRMLFGTMMILAIFSMLYQRSGKSVQAMPITIFILLLGIVCGFTGKFCVDTLGGDGYHWLMYWEVLCVLHFFLNVFTPFFFYVLHGAIQVSQDKISRPIFPFWMRRWLLYFVLILIPLCCGLLPFASPKTWWEDHFSKLIRNHLLPSYDDGNGLDNGYGSGFHG